MKKIVLTLIMLSALAASQAQLITFNALKNGVSDVAEIKKELILNGFTKVRNASDSANDTYAYLYDEEEKKAAIWVTITPFFENDSIARSYGASPGWCTIEMQSFGHEIYEYLKEEIVQYCTFEGIGFDDALEYKFKSEADFYISSIDGTNLIEVSPPLDSIFEAIEPAMMEALKRLLQKELEGQDTEQEVEDSYDTGGGLGDGISFGGLGSGRTARNIPKPDVSRCEVSSRIDVMVDIQVDREGRVVDASIRSASFADDCIWSMVVEAARKSRFSLDQNASFRQTGWIKYIIVP